MRHGTYWALHVFLVTPVILCMAVSPSCAEATSTPEVVLAAGPISSFAAVLACEAPISSEDWESLFAPDLCELILDDSSQDSMDDFHLPSPLLEHVSFCAEFNRAAGPSLRRAVGVVLSTQMVCCIWRC
jgi:hypothetical protein